jgi:phage anti-repressor protein
VKNEYEFLQNRLQASDEEMQVLCLVVSFEKESLPLNNLPVESLQIERDDFYGLGKEKEESFKHRKNDFDVLVDRNKELCVPYSKEKL